MKVREGKFVHFDISDRDCNFSCYWNVDVINITIENDEYYGKEAYAEGIEPSYSDTWRNYTYDKYGNWISRIEYVIPRYMGDPSDRDVERIIEYFE